MAGPVQPLSVEEDDVERQAKEHIEEIRRKVREAQKVDLAFLLDATGSMGALIKSVKEKIVEIAVGLKGAFPEDGTLRVACAFYRDYDADEELDAHSGKPRYQRSGICCPFTPDVREFQKQLQGLEAWGGGDDPEDVFSGLERLPELVWTAPATRIVYHIADAPCHGRRFHDPQYAKRFEDRAFRLERFQLKGATSEDDPEGRKIEEILARLAQESKISSYTFLHIHRGEGGERPKTAKMVEEFKKAKDSKPSISVLGIEEHIVQMGRGPQAIKALAQLLLQVVGDGLKNKVISMINDLVNKPSTMVSSSKAVLAEEIHVDATIPTDWSTVVPIRQVFCHRSVKYETVDKMLAQLEQGAPLDFRWTNAPIHVRITKHPFTHACATRWPFYAKMQVDPNSSEPTYPIVIKKFKYVDNCSLKDYTDPCKNPYLEVMETYAVASQLAVKFYDEIRTEKALDRAKVLYLDPPLATCKVASSTECFTVETLHSSAQWIKVDKKSDYYETLQAFSHWTYVFSEELLMIIVHTLILEGGTPEKAPRAVLCDPTIHSKKYCSRFRRTNTGEVGIEYFYNNHKCNDLCKVLGLEASH